MWRVGGDRSAVFINNAAAAHSINCHLPAASWCAGDAMVFQERPTDRSIDRTALGAKSHLIPSTVSDGVLLPPPGLHPTHATPPAQPPAQPTRPPTEEDGCLLFGVCLCVREARGFVEWQTGCEGGRGEYSWVCCNGRCWPDVGDHGTWLTWVDLAALPATHRLLISPTLDALNATHAHIYTHTRNTQERAAGWLAGGGKPSKPIDLITRAIAANLLK